MARRWQADFAHGGPDMRERRGASARCVFVVAVIALACGCTRRQPETTSKGGGSLPQVFVGVQCSSCHQDHNLELARIPGAPEWHLAPRAMAWVGKSPREICEQMKDPARNGGRTLAQIVDHNAHDRLVAWGWNPGHGREPAPGTQEQLGQLIAAWVETGAECPSEGGTP